MSISSISSSNIYTKKLNSINKYSKGLSSGKKVNNAADDPAGLAIIEKLTSQINGYDKAVSNIGDGQNLLQTADGGLKGITDSLQRMRELALQASNSFYTASDKASIQTEIDGIKQNISNFANYTEFNEKKLLDGSNSDITFAVGANGEEYNVSLGDALLENLGIADFDVTKSFNIDDIDKALDAVTSMRSTVGASYNAMDHMTASDLTVSLNLQSSRSRIADTDIPKYVSELKKNQLLNQYNLYMQKRIQSDKSNQTLQLMGMR